MSLRMFDIPAAFRQWRDAVDANDGELTPELEAQLAAIEADLFERLDAYADLIAEAEYEEDACRTEAKRVQKRAQQEAALIERLKAKLTAALKAEGSDKVRTPRGMRAALMRSPRPQIAWAFAGEIPEGFRKVRVEVDKDAAYEAWKLGVLPEGFEATHTEFVRITR
jgi:hypothetical protein